MIIGALFLLAGLCEIGGGYLVWGDAREQAAVLDPARSSDSGRLRSRGCLAAYIRVRAGLHRIRRHLFIALSLAWWVVVDGFRPDRYDLLGALICVAGMVIVVAPSRS